VNKVIIFKDGQMPPAEAQALLDRIHGQIEWIDDQRRTKPPVYRDLAEIEKLTQRLFGMCDRNRVREHQLQREFLTVHKDCEDLEMQAVVRGRMLTQALMDLEMEVTEDDRTRLQQTFVEKLTMLRELQGIEAQLGELFGEKVVLSGNLIEKLAQIDEYLQNRSESQTYVRSE
jgi:hypothetical protein